MAALPVLLGGLAISGGALALKKYLKPSTVTPYDVVIRINSLTDLSTDGWEIILSQNTNDITPTVATPENSNGVVVAVLGSYNRGKSFLLNQLCNIRLPSNNIIHTEGISITAAREPYKDIIFIDTAGTDTPIRHDKLDDKKATEALLREIALHLCSYVTIVVNRLRMTDQTYIREVLQHITKQPKEKKPEIIIVHNLLDVETIEDINKVIKDEIEDIYGAKLENVRPQINGQVKIIKLYCSSYESINIRHYILAKTGSPAANIWNSQSLDAIMNIFQMDTGNRRSLDVINNIISFVNTKLPQLFLNSDGNGHDSEIEREKLMVDKHVSEPYIVLSHRKELSREDRKTQPFTLKVSPKLIYDDTGYLIGINSIDCGQWQPRYSVYEDADYFKAIVELPGFKQGETRVEMLEDGITIKGNRDDFKKLLNSPVIHDSQIPIGSFKLNIPLRCRIENKEAKLEREDGLFKITCPKKKATVIYLE
ncbi:unnamed protein product [Didymodactylos carnosus]|uniref:SHSP domain-containing protein n=1 Tax=Didymodactylos carnosus TaxID=1234261 RepID=A0A815R7U3_9BILA|nr:unnamed protein product [Didymodactylos carnosus]CAF1472209.1 unnamed protein product [Didymodactylos carnosus]CAF3679884.1 unnamed protein product [Didymodactylos carnosus]CAF4339532.1 unnamed protein product [Didymodactylos carnosus]